MSNYKQIRLNPEVRELLDEYKMNGESYSIAIGRLIKEREYLWESKKELSEHSGAISKWAERKSLNSPTQGEICCPE